MDSSASGNQPAVINAAHFVTMAHGNVEWLRELALEFFDETRSLIEKWQDLMTGGDFTAMRAELHRCRGGAILFGVERFVATIAHYETPEILETEGFDHQLFLNELNGAAAATAALVVE